MSVRALDIPILGRFNFLDVIETLKQNAKVFGEIRSCNQILDEV